MHDDLRLQSDWTPDAASGDGLASLYPGDIAVRELAAVRTGLRISPATSALSSRISTAEASHANPPAIDGDWTSADVHGHRPFERPFAGPSTDVHRSPRPSVVYIAGTPRYTSSAVTPAVTPTGQIRAARKRCDQDFRDPNEVGVRFPPAPLFVHGGPLTCVDVRPVQEFGCCVTPAVTPTRNQHRDSGTLGHEIR